MAKIVFTNDAGHKSYFEFTQSEMAKTDAMADVLWEQLVEVLRDEVKASEDQKNG